METSGRVDGRAVGPGRSRRIGVPSLFLAVSGYRLSAGLTRARPDRSGVSGRTGGDSRSRTFPKPCPNLSDGLVCGHAAAMEALRVGVLDIRLRNAARSTAQAAIAKAEA